jgi:hypothetical protein
MGRYSVVVEDDEDAVCKEDESGKVTHILLVSCIGCACFDFGSNFV